MSNEFKVKELYSALHCEFIPGELTNVLEFIKKTFNSIFYILISFHLE